MKPAFWKPLRMACAAWVRSAGAPLRKREKSTSCESDFSFHIIMKGEILTGMKRLSLSTALVCGVILVRYNLHFQQCSIFLMELRRSTRSALEISISIL
jgi:hypothetical protein